MLGKEELLKSALCDYLSLIMKISSKTINKLEIVEIWVDEEELEWSTVWVTFANERCVSTIRRYFKNLQRGQVIHKKIPQKLKEAHHHLQAIARDLRDGQVKT